MGANAQTTVQKFVDGAVLTAAQQNTSAATGVPVFATAVTRDAAFGGANKVLAEGQTCYLESTNVVQFYDGAAWATVGPTAASGLVFITSGTLSGAAVKNVDNVFTSSYSNYVLKVNNASAVNSGAAFIDLQMRASGTTNATSNYTWASITNSYTTSVGGGASTNGTRWGFGGVDGVTSVTSASIEIGSPQLTAITTMQSNYLYSINVGSYFGFFNATTSFDGFSISVTGLGNFDNGTYSLYGYSNS